LKKKAEEFDLADEALYEGAVADLIYDAIFRKAKILGDLFDDFDSFVKHLAAYDVCVVCGLILLADYGLDLTIKRQVFVESVVYSITGKPKCWIETERIINTYIQ